MRKFKRLIVGIATFCTLFSMASVTNAAQTSTFYVSAGSYKYSSQTQKLDGKKWHYRYSVELKSFKFDYIPQNAAPSSNAKLYFRLYRKSGSNRYSAGEYISFGINGFTGKHLTKDEVIWKTIKNGSGKVAFTDGGKTGEYCLKTNSSYKSLGYGCTVDWWIQ